MFLQACVILFTGGFASVHAGIPPPPQEQAPPEQTPPGAGTWRRNPPEQTPSWEQVPPVAGPPPPQGAEHAGRYGQCTGGTHPTGMQSCLFARELEILMQNHRLSLPGLQITDVVLDARITVLEENTVKY